ncbi:hypothetical protein GCM10011409_15340 [Lentibacillus populi]|uniref:Uncharacterized protein n=1 Tax=Lentibacillus populi TaxID=1827502 RepID=A0A9W5TWC1_9BACI|nr:MULTISPECIES: hypothetical protein [Bacillaceae]MBT2214674.1 hypothetical protein [Virgibacillus dakarensis]GGB38782.1 hypothetical protein GCM10011409_15340 [Lentibacillus populi]
MNRIFKKNWNPILVVVVTIIFIAGLADIKYKGRFFQLLPNSIQAYLTK